MRLELEITLTQIPTTSYIAKYRDVAKFIEFCKKCGNYNNMWSCPPFSTTDHNPNSTLCRVTHIENFDLVTIIGVKINLEETIRKEPTNTQERDIMIRDILSKVRGCVDREILSLEQQITPSLAYYAGSCRICAPNRCSRTKNEPCIHPDQMRSTLEAIGFDMGRTTSELLGIELKWCDGNELPPYFTLVYGFLTNSPAMKQVKGIFEKMENIVSINEKTNYEE